MAEKYVSVSELRKLLGVPEDGQCTGCQFSTLHGCKDDSIQRACEGIDDAPEADVRPVVHGKWIDMGDFEQCSHCTGTHLKEVQTVYGKAIWIKSDFCPNCGADMRQERGAKE